MGIGEMDRGIPSSTLATLRGILVSSLSRENLGPHDITQVEQISRHRISRKVHFREGAFLCFYFWLTFMSSRANFEINKQAIYHFKNL